jgi:hypothetical protein
MKYADKAKARTRPYIYDVDSKQHQQGAHRHWFGKTTESGHLNEFGKRALAFDIRLLSQRRRNGHVFVE